MLTIVEKCEYVAIHVDMAHEIGYDASEDLSATRTQTMFKNV